jgi:hypothetical protein
MIPAPCLVKHSRNGCGNDATQILTTTCCGTLIFFCDECPTKLKDFVPDELRICEFCGDGVRLSKYVRFFSILS